LIAASPGDPKSMLPIASIDDETAFINDVTAFTYDETLDIGDETLDIIGNPIDLNERREATIAPTEPPN
jgi:hypothetical protein